MFKGLFCLLLPVAAFAQPDAAGPFLGRWDLTVSNGSGREAGWLEVAGTAGALKVRMVGRVSSIKTPERALIRDGELHLFTQDWFGQWEKEEYVLRRAGARLTGFIQRDSGQQMPVVGLPAPSLERSGPVQWGKPLILLNPSDHHLDTWRTDAPNNNHWRLEGHVLTSPSQGANIFTLGEFEDFKLHIEFNCAPGCNSGVYLRGRYEIQIASDHKETPPPNTMTGSVYGIVAPKRDLFKPGEWQRFDVTLIGRRVTLVWNGETVIENAEIPSPTGEARDSHEELPGPILLQAHGGSISYRNIVLTPAVPRR